MQSEPYDPDWLVALATAQHADKPWLTHALSCCKTVVKRTQYVVHFVDPTDANKPGAAWQFETTLWLTDPVAGNLGVDVLKDGRIGAIEFYDRLVDGM